MVSRIYIYNIYIHIYIWDLLYQLSSWPNFPHGGSWFTFKRLHWCISKDVAGEAPRFDLLKLQVAIQFERCQWIPRPLEFEHLWIVKHRKTVQWDMMKHQFCKLAQYELSTYFLIQVIHCVTVACPFDRAYLRRIQRELKEICESPSRHWTAKARCIGLWIDMCICIDNKQMVIGRTAGPATDDLFEWIVLHQVLAWSSGCVNKTSWWHYYANASYDSLSHAGHQAVYKCWMIRAPFSYFFREIFTFVMKWLSLPFADHQQQILKEAGLAVRSKVHWKQILKLPGPRHLHWQDCTSGQLPSSTMEEINSLSLKAASAA